MRIAWLAPGLMLAMTAACGGIDKPNDSTSPPTCGHGPNLVLTASSVIVAPVDVPVPHVHGASSAFVLLSSLAATTDGKNVVATWTTGDSSLALQGHVVVAHLGAGGVTGTTAPVDAPAVGVAAFDGTDFLVVGRASGVPVLPDGPSSLQLQRVALDGSAVGAPETIANIMGVSSVSSAVWTPRGLAVAWSTFGSPAMQATTVVQLFGADGHLMRGLALDPAGSTEPNTGLLEFDPAAVTVFHGQLVVAKGHTVQTLDWLGGPAQTSQTRFTAYVPEKGGFPTLFETGGQLRIWGFGGEPSDAGGFDPDSGPIERVYAGAPGGAFRQVGAVDFSAVTQRSDGCGGAVTLSNHDTAISLVSDTAPERIVSLGTSLLTADTVAAMATIPSGFAVVWVADDGMHLATLAWR
jgi:hypothetical protein